MKYFSISIFVALLVGCRANIKTQDHGVRESTKSPIIEFVAKTDMKKWDEYAQDVRWGIAVSTSNITTVINDGWSYNEPVYDIPEYAQYTLKSGIKSFEKVSIPVNPGVHDWLILLDLDNNGTWDTYLGSAEEHIKLDKIKFQNGFIYSVVVGEDSIPKLEIKSNKLSQQDAASGAAA